MNSRPIQPVVSSGYEEMTIDSFDTEEDAKKVWLEQTYRFPDQIQSFTFTRCDPSGKRRTLEWWCVVDLHRAEALQRVA